MHRPKKKSSKSKNENNAPRGWILGGIKPDDYQATLDESVFHSGTRSCCVTGAVKKPSGWTTLMQDMGPADYLSKRLRMSFWLRTEDVEFASGWMRVDGQGTGQILSFDNMCSRKIVGSHDWTEHQIVLNVPSESTKIAYGVILRGPGRLWLDEISFDVVDESVPVTSCKCSPGNVSNKAPKNLNFEE